MTYTGAERRKESAEFCEDVARRASEMTLEKTFAILGVDIHDPQQVADFQDSLRYLARLKKISDHGILALVAALSVGLVGVIFLGFITKVKGG
ncbi:MAG: hypothetical protein LBD68_11395 [Zoogloeaceae bacterium]|nr:hypothetical protein [Zoogloeaceae bacterium]